jgi:CheY-like chemotaxis protein
MNQTSRQLSALIVDDNDTYAAMLLRHLEPDGFHFDRARSAGEGLEMLQKNGAAAYSLIVTDITMEGQTAGMKLIRQLRRKGYRGIVLVASTGFNFPPVLFISRFFLRLWGVDVLTPKEPLRKGELVCVAVTAAGREFLKVRKTGRQDGTNNSTISA